MINLEKTRGEREMVTELLSTTQEGNDQRRHLKACERLDDVIISVHVEYRYLKDWFDHENNINSKKDEQLHPPFSFAS